MGRSDTGACNHGSAYWVHNNIKQLEWTPLLTMGEPICGSKILTVKPRNQSKKVTLTGSTQTANAG